jgi:hypothetical protein
MMADDELVVIDLTDDERLLMFHGLNEFLGPARGAPLLTPLLGLSSVENFYTLVRRLREAMRNHESLSNLDWERALLLTEISWASAVLGAGLDFATNFRDEEAAPLLRSIQYKVSNYERFRLLLENSNCRPAESGQA